MAFSNVAFLLEHLSIALKFFKDLDLKDCTGSETNKKIKRPTEDRRRWKSIYSILPIELLEHLTLST